MKKRRTIAVFLITLAVVLFGFDAYNIQLWLIAHAGEPTSTFPILTCIGFGILYLGKRLFSAPSKSDKEVEE